MIEVVNHLLDAHTALTADAGNPKSLNHELDATARGRQQNGLLTCSYATSELVAFDPRRIAPTCGDPPL